MKIMSQLVDWFVELYPLPCQEFVVIERGERFLYLQVLQAIYGMLEAGLLWYRKFRKDLEGNVFLFNWYYGCVANKNIRNSQQTIRFHVDDLLSSQKDPEVKTEFAEWNQRKNGTLKLVKVHHGKVHEFIGMKLDFSIPGECHIIQDDHIEDLVLEWPEKINENDGVLTPASNTLFETGGGRLLSE